MSNGCSRLSQSNIDAKTNLSNVAKRNQLKVEGITESDQSIMLSLSGDEGNKFLKSIYQIGCLGYRFKGITISSEDETLSILKAKFEVQRVK